jgi:hypothetical protein
MHHFAKFLVLNGDDFLKFEKIAQLVGLEILGLTGLGSSSG